MQTIKAEKQRNIKWRNERAIVMLLKQNSEMTIPEIAEKLKAAGIRVTTIEKLRDRAYAEVGMPDPIRYTDKIVGVAMYRDNTVIDVIRQIEE